MVLCVNERLASHYHLKCGINGLNYKKQPFQEEVTDDKRGSLNSLTGERMMSGKG